MRTPVHSLDIGQSQDMGFIETMSYSTPIHGMTQWDMKITGFGEIVFEENYKPQQDDHEWMCEYCLTPNDNKNTNCHRCDAARSFIYGNQ